MVIGRSDRGRMSMRCLSAWQDGILDLSSLLDRCKACMFDGGIAHSRNWKDVWFVWFASLVSLAGPRYWLRQRTRTGKVAHGHRLDASRLWLSRSPSRLPHASHVLVWPSLIGRFQRPSSLHASHLARSRENSWEFSCAAFDNCLKRNAPRAQPSAGLRLSYGWSAQAKHAT